MCFEQNSLPSVCLSLSRKLSGQPGNMIVKLPATGFTLSREVRAAGRGVGGGGGKSRSNMEFVPNWKL